MIDIEKTAANPATFMRLYGLKYASFKILLAKVDAYIQLQKQAQPISQRGRKASLVLARQLLLTLVYLRQYVTFLSLGHQFGISESYAYKRYIFIRKIRLQVLDLPDSQQLRQAVFTHPVGLAVSEQPIERPLKNQQPYYSGKKKDIR